MSSIPYSEARAGGKAREEIVRILQRFGCESVGFMDEFTDKSVMLAFKWRGRDVQLRASAQGWANLWLKENPWSDRRKLNEHEWKQKALNQGMIAVNSVLRDWVKGQVTAIEIGVFSFEHVFMPHMLTNDGTSLLERVQSQGLLPPPALEEG